MDIKNLVPMEYSAQRVLTTEQLAQVYECETRNISDNFKNNESQFEEGLHYFKLTGDELRAFKSQSESFGLPISKFTSTFYLWTKQGAVRHCKMLNTVKAWEMFNLLEENYFNLPKIEAMPHVQKELDEIILSVGRVREAIQKVYGVKDGIALAQATNLTGTFYKFNLSELKALIPPAEHETGYMNATQLGEKVGKTARAVNQFLKEKGLQYREGKNWRLTEKGKRYAEEIPYDTGKHSGYQIRWSLSVAELFPETR